MADQLAAMKSGSIQTDKLIAASSAQAQAANTNAAIAQQAMIAGLRAWVGPQDAHLDGTPTKDQTLTVVVNYLNTGREPALGFAYSVKPFPVVRNGESYAVGTSGLNDFTKTCNALERPIASGVVYPSTTFTSYELSTTIDPNMVNDQLIEKKLPVAVMGCFAYKSAGDVHRSEFCYLFIPDKTKPEHLNICADGNYAN